MLLIGTPLVVTCHENIERSTEEIHECRGITTIPYSVFSLPKLSNAVRELLKCIYEANMGHYKALLCSVKYLIYKKYYCYQMKPEVNINEPW